MAKAKSTKSSKTKDFASKRTLNPDADGPPTPAPGVTEEQQAPREVGQFTGRGTAPLQKK